MTGLEVLVRCKKYERDVNRLKNMLLSLRDALTRVTRATDAQGHGGGEDKMSALVAREDELARALSARHACYNMELCEALRLVGALDNAEMSGVLYDSYVQGETVLTIASGRKMSEESVRGYKKRGTALMRRTRSALSDDAEYKKAREAMQRAHFHAAQENDLL